MTGACCNEMDVWEANSRANQIAPHPCNQTGLYRCTGDECAADGVCDKNGCGWNPYRLNQPEYYGRGANYSVDTTKPFTVVTQFPADESGKLKEIHRIYVQDDKVIKAEVVKKEGVPAVAFTNDEYCNATGATKFMDLGAHEVMGGALTRGMVLAFSVCNIGSHPLPPPFWGPVSGDKEFLFALRESSDSCCSQDMIQPSISYRKKYLLIDVVADLVG